MHACTLILYVETYGFEYVKGMASKDVMARGDGPWQNFRYQSLSLVLPAVSPHMFL